MIRQPIGVFPGLASFFLLPSVEQSEQLMPSLLQGYLPETPPKAWRFFVAAVHGKDEETVLSLLDDTKESTFNHFVLVPNKATYNNAKEACQGVPSYEYLLDAIAWRLQLSNMPPDYEKTEGEVRAFIKASHAYEALQRASWDKGLKLLKKAQAIVKESSPVFAARLLAEIAATEQMIGKIEEQTIKTYKKALLYLEKSAFTHMRAELYFQLGTALQEIVAYTGPHNYLEAIKAYNKAIKLYDKEKYPLEYAMTHMNLALAYLGMPDTSHSDVVKTVTAIQSLREALRYVDKQTEPDLWASVTINLANTLQYAKSSHIEDNLWEAVSLYADVLKVRTKESDPLGYARLIANQGTALSHLGAFSRAVPQLEEARELFLVEGEPDAAKEVDKTLQKISNQKRRMMENKP